MNSAGRGAKGEPGALKARASYSAPLVKGMGDRSTFFGLCLIGKMVSVQVRAMAGNQDLACCSLQDRSMPCSALPIV